MLGDPYKTQTEATVKFVMNRLQKLGYNNKHTLAYQSRVGPVEWVKPYTDETIRSLAASGVTKMVTVPISFVSEHIETLGASPPPNRRARPRARPPTPRPAPARAARRAPRA